jgi:3-methyladenine DNA glycosylase AlkD
MSSRPYLVQIRAAFRPLADPRRAESMRAYLREQFSFIGIPAPARRAAIKQLPVFAGGRKELLELAALLWKEPEREYRYTAIDLLARHVTQLSLEDLPRLEALALDAPWWETVDGLAGVVGDVMRAARARNMTAQRTMDRWLVKESFWLRRIAMIHQLGWRGDTDEVRLFAYADQLAQEPEFFIRKAIGWALRDYARTRPDSVRTFLASRRSTLSPLTQREAAKHLG